MLLGDPTGCIERPPRDAPHQHAKTEAGQPHPKRRSPLQNSEIPDANPTGASPGAASGRGNCDDPSDCHASRYATPSEGKRKYPIGRQPKARARPNRAVAQVRATSGKHIFAARPKGCRPSRMYSRVIRNWKRVPAFPSETDNDTTRRDWIQVARYCRDELLCAGTAAGNGGEQTPPFLILAEDNQRADNGGGGRVVFTCRSHSSAENYRCRAAWRFVVSDIGGGFFRRHGARSAIQRARRKTYRRIRRAPPINDDEVLLTDRIKYGRGILHSIKSHRTRYP